MDTGAYLGPDETAVASWVQKNNKHAGATTNTLPSAKCLYMSIRGTGGALAVAAIVTKNREKPEAFEKNFMVAILDECGLALEKEMTGPPGDPPGQPSPGHLPRSAHPPDQHLRQCQYSDGGPGAAVPGKAPGPVYRHL